MLTLHTFNQGEDDDECLACEFKTCKTFNRCRLRVKENEDEN
jgi:hypothetical protein